MVTVWLRVLMVNRSGALPPDRADRPNVPAGAGGSLDRRRRRRGYRAVGRLLPVPGRRGGGALRAGHARPGLYLGRRGLDQSQRVGTGGRTAGHPPGPVLPRPTLRAAVP